NHVAALDATTTTNNATPWNPNSNGTIVALVVDGATVCAGGGFTSIEGQPQAGLAVLVTDVVGVPESPATEAVTLSPVIPQPVRSRGRIRFTLAAQQIVTLAIYDLAGRRVASLLDRALKPAGPHEVEVGTKGWRSGVYCYRLTAGTTIATRKIIVLD